MSRTTPPKGRPTPGRRDRSVARYRSRSRQRIIRYAWAVVGVCVLLALLVLGSGTGGDAITPNVVLPVLTLGPARRILTDRRW